MTLINYCDYSIIIIQNNGHPIFQKFKIEAMKTKYIFQFSAIIISTLLFTSCKKNGVHFCNGNDKITATSEVFATGLNNPRGLKFGPNNQLYVAEGGIGGKTTT